MASVTDTTSTSSTSSINSSTSTASNTVLDKDAFLKLLLVEMQHQDPTDPMDSDKMLTQTSQLAALEMQQNTNTTMEKMVETMEVLSSVMLSSGQLSVLSAIGRTATIGETTFPITSSGESIDVRMYLPKETKDGATFQVLDSNGNVVRNIKVEKDDLLLGTNIIKWSGTDDDGNYVGAGNYTMKVSYTDIDGGTTTSSFGSYPIESIRFKDGVPEAQLAGKYVTFDQISEIS